MPKVGFREGSAAQPPGSSSGGRSGCSGCATGPFCSHDFVLAGRF